MNYIFKVNSSINKDIKLLSRVSKGSLINSYYDSSVSSTSAIMSVERLRVVIVQLFVGVNIGLPYNSLCICNI